MFYIPLKRYEYIISGSIMNIKPLKKILVIGIIFIFIGVSYSSAITVEPKLFKVNNQSKDNCNCEETLNPDLIKIKGLVNKVKIY